MRPRTGGLPTESIQRPVCWQHARVQVSAPAKSPGSLRSAMARRDRSTPIGNRYGLRARFSHVHHAKCGHGWTVLRSSASELASPVPANRRSARLNTPAILISRHSSNSCRASASKHLKRHRLKPCFWSARTSSLHWRMSSGDKKRLIKEIQALERKLQSAVAEHEAAGRDIGAWKDQWKEAVAGFGLKGDALPA